MSDENFDEFKTQISPILEQFGYRIKTRLGSGSYSTVVTAYSEKHGTNVAIKVIAKKNARSEFLQKFLPREIEIVKTIKHQNLVLFLQTIETNSRVYVVMEDVAGGNILQLIQKHKRVSEGRAGVWFRQMCDGIEYCHSRGVVHRDLKCENLLLDSDENIKIIDFGFARSEMLPVNGLYKVSETYCGSYAYAAPEILIGIPYIPQLADIWSMGVILYVMAVGELPFSDKNLKELVKAVQNGPIFPSIGLSFELQELITLILTKEESRLWFRHIRMSDWFKTHGQHRDHDQNEQ